MAALLSAALATLVFCAPGYPGAPGDAQPYVDQFAKAAVAAAGWEPGSLAAVYDPTEPGSVAKLGQPDAVLAFVPFPFFVEHSTQFHLVPLAQAVVAGAGRQERWKLVAKTGRVTGAASLAGYTILSVAGYAPDFVRHSALAQWTLPADVKIEATGQILSALRRIASGERIVALLDYTQAAALPTLPFAAQLQTVTQSAELPVAILATVDSRLPPARTHSFQAALLKMGHGGAGVEAMKSLQLQSFVLPRIPSVPPAP